MEDYQYWSLNDKIYSKNKFVNQRYKRNPFDANGLGKPERLKKIFKDIFQEE